MSAPQGEKTICKPAKPLRSGEEQFVLLGGRFYMQMVHGLMQNMPAQRLHYVATDGLSYFMRRELEEMPEENFRLLVKYHLSICEKSDLVGATAHSLDIFRKM